MTYVVANDVTGIGAADDGALVPLGAMLWDNLTLIFGQGGIYSMYYNTMKKLCDEGTYVAVYGNLSDTS